MLVKLPNSINSFGKVAVIQKFQYFQSFVWGDMSCNMAAQYKTLLNFGNIEIFENFGNINT